MNSPTREEFDELKGRVTRVEQQTEPISLKIERGLPIPEATLLQEIMNQVGRHGPDIATIKGTMATKDDIGALRGDMNRIETRLNTVESKLDRILAKLP